jgi:hypothetical protein
LTQGRSISMDEDQPSGLRHAFAGEPGEVDALGQPPARGFPSVEPAAQKSQHTRMKYRVIVLPSGWSGQPNGGSNVQDRLARG